MRCHYVHERNVGPNLADVVAVPGMNPECDLSRDKMDVHCIHASFEGYVQQMASRPVINIAHMLTLTDMLTIGSCSKRLQELCLGWDTSSLVSQAMLPGAAV